MKRADQKKRENEILTFIYRVKTILPRHLQSMFGFSKRRSEYYLSNLEKKKILSSAYFSSLSNTNSKFIGLIRDKAYFLNAEGLKRLRSGLTEEKKKDFYRYKVTVKELEHDAMVTDILIYFLKTIKGITEYKTDFELRREMNKREERYRIPDFVFTDKDGDYLVEYEASPRSLKRLREIAHDLKAYYRKHTKIIISGAEKLKKYEKIFEENNVKPYILGQYSVKDGLEVIKEV